MATQQGRANRAAEKLAETTRDSYKTVFDHMIGLQERNVRFAQSVVEDSFKELRQRTESSRSTAREMAERVEKQRGAHQTLVNESVDAYMDLVYAPFSYYRKGLQAVK